MKLHNLRLTECYVETGSGAAWFATWRALVQLGMDPCHAQHVADTTHRIIPCNTHKETR